MTMAFPFDPTARRPLDGSEDIPCTPSSALRPRSVPVPHGHHVVHTISNIFSSCIPWAVIASTFIHFSISSHELGHSSSIISPSPCSTNIDSGASGVFWRSECPTWTGTYCCPCLATDGRADDHTGRRTCGESSRYGSCTIYPAMSG